MLYLSPGGDKGGEMKSLSLHSNNRNSQHLEDFSELREIHHFNTVIYLYVYTSLI